MKKIMLAAALVLSFGAVVVSCVFAPQVVSADGDGGE